MIWNIEVISMLNCSHDNHSYIAIDTDQNLLFQVQLSITFLPQ